MTNEDDDLKDKFEVSESKLESLTKHMHNSEKYAQLKDKISKIYKNSFKNAQKVFTKNIFV